MRRQDSKRLAHDEVHIGALLHFVYKRQMYIIISLLVS